MDIRWFQNRSNFFVQLAFNFETLYYSLFLGTLLFCFWLLFLEPQSCQKEVGFFTFVSLLGQKKAEIEFFFWNSCRYSKFHISGYTQCSGRRLISRRMFFARTRRHKAWIIILCSLLRNKGPTHGQSRISKAVLNEWIYLDKCVHPGTNTIDSICLFKPSKENIPGIPSFLVQ